MARKITGITVKLGLDGKEVTSQLKDLDKAIAKSSSELREIDRALKLDPTNTELLAQKQEVLAKALEKSREKLQALEQMQNTAAKAAANNTEWEQAYAPIAEAIEKVTAELRDLQKKKEDMDKKLASGEISQAEYDEYIAKLNEAKQAQKDLRKQKEELDARFAEGHITADEYRAYRRELEQVRAETARLENAMETAGESTDKISESVSNLATETEKANKEIITFGDLLKSNIVGDLIADGMQEASDAIADFVKNGVELASNLEEVQNVVDTTFGAGAQQIYKWSDAAAEGFGISSLQAQKMNGTLGAMLKSMGLSSEAIIQMSTDMVGLTGDMASFYNLDAGEAFEKIRSGISGETEPLKQLGINMSVANLEAYALAQGIETAYKKMSQAEQAQLRYSYLMSVTADAQGDFARTADSYANQQRILQLNIENLSATLGQSLLPHLNETITLINNKLPEAGPAIEKISEILGKMLGFVIDNSEAILAFAGAFATYKIATEGATKAQLIFNAAANANPYALIASAAIIAGAKLIAFADSLTDVSKKYKEIADESINAAKEQEQSVNSLESELESLNKKIDEIQSKGPLSITDEKELSYLQLENEKLTTQLALEKEILAVKKAQKQDDVIGALSMNADYEGSIAYAQNQLEQYKKLQQDIDYWNGQIVEAQKTGDENLKYVAETYVKEYSEKALEYKVGALEALQAVNDFAKELDNTTDASKKALKDVENLNEAILEYFNIAAETEETSENAISPSVQIAESPAQIAADEMIKKYQQEAKQIAKSRKEINKNLSEGWEQAEHDYATGVIASEEELYQKKLKIWNTYGNKDIKEHWKYYEELYQTEQEFYQDRLDAQKEAEEKRLEQHKESLEEQIKTVEDAVKEIESEYSGMLKDISSEQDAYKNKLLDVAELFTSEKKKDKEGNEYELFTLENIDKQIKAVEAYDNKLKKLEARGAGAGLVSYVQGLSQDDSEKVMHVLGTMTDEQLKAYSDKYDKLINTVNQRAEERYAPQVEAVNAGFVEKIRAIMGELPEEMSKVGTDSIDGFIKGFTGKQSELIDSVSKYCDGLLGSFKSNLDINSPSKETEALGEYAGEGFEKGLASISGADAARTFADDFISAMAEKDSELKDVLYGAFAGNAASAIAAMNAETGAALKGLPSLLQLPAMPTVKLPRAEEVETATTYKTDTSPINALLEEMLDMMGIIDNRVASLANREQVIPVTIPVTSRIVMDGKTIAESVTTYQAEVRRIKGK